MVDTSSKDIRFPPSALDAACTWCTGLQVPSADTNTRLARNCKARSAVFLMASAALLKLLTFSSALFARAASDPFGISGDRERIADSLCLQGEL